MKDTMKFKKNMRFMMAVFIVMLAALIIYMFYSIVTYGEQWFATPYNPRVQKAMQSIDAGAILDRNGKSWHGLATEKENISAILRYARRFRMW